MIVIFPLLVSKNVNSNLVQGMAIVLEQYIASYAISDFVGKSKEFNKFYNYKVKGGKIYKESDSTWFDIDPLTRGILEEHEYLSEARGSKGRKKLRHQAEKNRPSTNTSNSQGTSAKKGVPGSAKHTTLISDPSKEEVVDAVFDPKGPSFVDKAEAVGKAVTDITKALQDLKKNKDTTEKDKEEPLSKPVFTKATISTAMLNLEPTWVIVNSKEGGEQRIGIKVVPMMIEGFNIKHTISLDMQKYFLQTFTTGIGRKVMRLVYRLVDRWTAFGQRPRGDVRHDLFYARTGHDGQPFILVDKHEDIPKLFFSQPQNMLKLWKLSWGNLVIADDISKTVMFCMKKYKGMCSNFTYSMIFTQTKEMGKVFEDMEDARKATGALFKMNKKITSLGGK